MVAGGSKHLEQAWVVLISQAQELWENLNFPPLRCLNRWPNLLKVGQRGPCAMDNGWRFSLTVDSVVLMGLVGNTCSLLKDIGNMLRLLYYFMSAANCSEDRKPSCLFHPWREVNPECQGKIIGASRLILSLG